MRDIHKNIQEEYSYLTRIMLENHTALDMNDKSNRYLLYKEWVSELDVEKLKGVIIGCAEFRLINSNKRLFSKDKESKIIFKSNVEISEMYLAFAKELLYVKDTK
jgi:hypothetical protein